jgi:hypothetical protein
VAPCLAGCLGFGRSYSGSVSFCSDAAIDSFRFLVIIGVRLSVSEAKESACPFGRFASVDGCAKNSSYVFGRLIRCFVEETLLGCGFFIPSLLSLYDLLVFREGSA